MSPAERRARLIALLAKIDQEIAECEDLAAQEVLAYDEVEYLAIQLKFRRETRDRVEAMLGTGADTR
jgi:hypothetical protein